MEIIEELMEIWPNEVCDRKTIRCYESSKKEINSHAFEHLIHNIKLSNYTIESRYK